MKDRVILLTSTVLVVTMALFAWFTWARWGVVGIYPILGWLVVGSAFIAIALASRFLLSKRRRSPAPQPAPIAPQPVPGETCQEVSDKTEVTTVEI
jgi:hypothetical protein